MFQRKYLTGTVLLASIAGFAAQANFSTSEYGTGEFNTGTINSFIHGIDSFTPISSADLSGTITELENDCTSSNFPDEIDFMDANADGSLSCAEVNTALSSTTGVSYTSTSKQQATFILTHLDGCASVDAACLAAAATAANNFMTSSLSDAGPSALTTLATAISGGSNATTSSIDDDLQIFDTNHDGSISDTEIVALLNVDPNISSTINQPSGDSGLYARAYLTEIAALGADPSAADINSAITDGNGWAVYAPQISAPSSLALDGTDSTVQSDAFTVYDGVCATSGGSGCTAAPGNVSYAVTTTMGSTTWAAGNSANPFTVNSDGRIVVNTASSSISSIEDLDAGTYTINVTATDNNTDTYALTDTVSSLSVTVSNENGCIVDNGVVAGDFNAGTSSNISGGAVTISGNHNGNDLLFVKGATTTSIANGKRYTSFGYSGITAEYSTSGGVLRFYGTTSEANWVEIFKKVGYIYNSSGSASQNTRSLIFSMSNKVPYQHPTDSGWRFYEYISNEDVNFDTIMDDVDDNGYQTSSDKHYLFGLKPYLATITSSAEQAYIQPKIQGQGWIGGCDNLAGSGTRAACNVGDNEFDGNTDRTDGKPFQNAWRNEGEWVWVTGPERGIPFGSDGTSGCSGGQSWTAHNSGYQNWNGSHEPNNCNHEHHLHVLGSGKWNDYNYHDDRINGYIVEWGGPSTDSTYGQVNGSALDLIETKSYNMSTEGQFCAHQ